MTIDEKRQLISATDPDLTVRQQCDLLGLNRSSYYYQPTPVSGEDEKLMQLLDRHYTKFPRHVIGRGRSYAPYFLRLYLALGKVFQSPFS